MAENQGKEEEKFDFTPEGEGYISLDEARVLAMRTAVGSPGNYGSAYQGVDMVFDVVESTETDDHYNITLSFRPQGSFDGTPGQEQFVIGKEGTIAVRQVLSSIVRKGGGFPVIPVAIGLVVVGIIAAAGAVFVMMGSGGDSVPIAAVSPTETPIPGSNSTTGSHRDLGTTSAYFHTHANVHSVPNAYPKTDLHASPYIHTSPHSNS